jgi:hypothetical protein
MTHRMTADIPADIPAGAWPMTLATALLAVAASAAALSPATAWAGTEARNVAEFDAVALEGSFELKISQGSPASVQVTADDKLLPLIETVVDKGRLVVRWKKGSRTWGYSGSDTIQVAVVAPTLKAVATAGSGDIQMQAFTTPALKLAIAGSGNAVLSALTTEELSVGVSGSGDVKGAGKATKLTVSIAGSGDVKLLDMRSEETKVSIAGSGSAAVNAGKTLAVSIAGSGDVVYTGDAQVKSSVSGSGSVSRK